MDTTTDRAAPAAWTEALDRSAAEIARGCETTPIAVVVQELRESADRLEARIRARRATDRSAVVR